LLSQVAPQDSRGSLDMEWLEDTARKNNRETNRLEAELKGYKNNLLKESIRVSRYAQFSIPGN
jgi:COP9 signalosome complex subunit 1